MKVYDYIENLLGEITRSWKRDMASILYEHCSNFLDG